MIVVDFLCAPGAVDMDWTVWERGVGELVIERDGGLRAAGYEDQAFGVVFEGAFGIFRFLTADPVVDLSAEGADWVPVVADLNGRNTHIREENALNAHANVGEVCHLEVVVPYGREVVAIGGSIEMPDFREDAVVCFFIFIAEFDQDEVVFFGEGFEEWKLRTIYTLPGEPHAGQDGDAALFRLICNFRLAERGLLDQSIDALLDEVVLLMIDIGSAEVDVVAQSVDSSEAVVFVVDVGAEGLKGEGVRASDSIAFAEAVVPESGEGWVGVEEEFAIKGGAVVKVIEDEEFSEVALLPE